jgi:aspartate aminotransferase-like enzyme
LDKLCLVIRNGFFSFRWTQIFDAGSIPSESIILKARPVDSSEQASFAPAPIDKVVKTITTENPDIVFAPHVETSSGMILPVDYICTVGEAVHTVG